MALVLPHSIFFHAGRTAGHYVRQVIREMEIPTYEIGRFHDWPRNINLNEVESAKLYFCFVRHPLSWLRSYWCHEMQFGWSRNEFAENLRSDSFAEFLRNAINAYPNGPVSEAFEPFVSQCHEVGRQENLNSDLTRILMKANEKIRPSVLESAGVISVDIDLEIRQFAQAPKELLEEVLKVESKFCQRWGYTGIPSNMIGIGQTCYATYVPLKVCKELSKQDIELMSGNTNAFSLNEMCIPGIPETRRTTMYIKKVLETIEMGGREVIDLACADGVFSFYAETRGASKVTGIALGMPVETVGALSKMLNSKVEFHNAGFYGVENLVNRKYDLAFCFRMLELLRYPFLAIRTMSRLLKDGGGLILECGVLNAYKGVPLMLVPVGDESPMLSRESTFFNKEGLLNALSTYGFHDFKIHYAFTHGIDRGRSSPCVKMESENVSHESESAVGRILLSCKWSSSQMDQDPRYLKDGVGGQYLLDYWDSQLPTDNIPGYQPTQENLLYLKKQVSIHNEIANKLQQELIAAKSAIQDRESTLIDTRNLLVERTNLLEQVSKELRERTQELEDTRQILIERTRRLEAALKLPG